MDLYDHEHPYRFLKLLPLLLLICTLFITTGCATSPCQPGEVRFHWVAATDCVGYGLDQVCITNKEYVQMCPRRLP